MIFSFTTNHYQPLQLRRARETFPREKCLLPRQKLKRAYDAMDTGAHDVARDDTQISHFLGLITAFSFAAWTDYFSIAIGYIKEYNSSCSHTLFFKRFTSNLSWICPARDAFKAVLRAWRLSFWNSLALSLPVVLICTYMQEPGQAYTCMLDFVSRRIDWGELRLKLMEFLYTFHQMHGLYIYCETWRA